MEVCRSIAPMDMRVTFVRYDVRVVEFDDDKLCSELHGVQVQVILERVRGV